MNFNDDKTRTLLLEQCRTYPGLQLLDLFKFIYQSAFGCEHLISDPSAMIDYIKREAETAAPHRGPVIEELDGDYVRVYLDVLKQGVSAEALGMAFTKSAVHIEEGPAHFARKLQVLKSLAEEGAIPFSLDLICSEIDAWEKAGFEAVHHSRQYEALYKPAYRLVRRDYLKDLGL